MVWTRKLAFTHVQDDAKVCVVNELEEKLLKTLHDTEENDIRLATAKLLRVITCCSMYTPLDLTHQLQRKVGYPRLLVTWS